MSLQIPKLKLSLVMVSLLVVAALSPAQDAVEPATEKPYVRTGAEATLSGRINLAGKLPRPRVLDMSADLACYRVNRRPRSEWFKGNRGRLANVFVYVKSEVLDAYTFAPPHSPAILEHKGCRYVPHVLGMQLGQQLMIFNRDPTQHNTHPVPKTNREWNQTQAEGSPPITRMFELPETFILFKDNQHPWENARVGIFTNPFFAISDQNGNYRIEGLPAGRYTVVAWHERLGEQSSEVVLVPGESKKLSFTYDAKGAAALNR